MGNKEDIEVVNFSHNHIFTCVEDTNVYANGFQLDLWGTRSQPYVKNVESSQTGKALNQSPWMVIVDFNEILFPRETVRGVRTL